MVYINYIAVVLEQGFFDIDVLGDGINAPFVHEIFCLNDGIIRIVPMMGQTFEYNARRGDRIFIVPKRIEVFSGKFVGFKGKFFNNIGI